MLLFGSMYSHTPLTQWTFNTLLVVSTSYSQNDHGTSDDVYEPRSASMWTRRSCPKDPTVFTQACESLHQLCLQFSRHAFDSYVSVLSVRAFDVV